jgi:putative ABC transport system permease protein
MSPSIGFRKVLTQLNNVAFWEATRTSFSEIWAHKLRSLLTFVGVMLGTTALIVMVTMMEGLKAVIWEGAASLGFDGVFFVSGQAPSNMMERKKLSQSRGMTVRDVDGLTEGSERLRSVAGVRMRDDVVHGNGLDRRARVYGVTRSYANVHDRTVIKGRWFDLADEQDTRRVAILGVDLAEMMFGSRDPMGADIRVGNAVFRVIGVEGRIGNQVVQEDFAKHEMEGVLVPLASYRAYLDGGESVSYLSVRTDDIDNLGLVKAEVARLMRRSHRGVGDFEIENVAEEMVRARERVGKLLRNMSFVLGAIAGISLLVGGVGIYSVMKISLAERLFEIGLRKAIGASDGSIMLQFLVESTTLSILGAVVGCVLAAVITALASSQFEAGLPLAPLGLTLGVGFAVGVGVFAGLFPSLSAARMTPVDCLRG